MPIQPKEDFYLPGLEGNVVGYAETVFRVVVAHISEQKYQSHMPWLIRSEAQNNEFIVEKLDRQLPETNYVLVSTPLQGFDVKRLDRKVAQAKILRIEGP